MKHESADPVIEMADPASLRTNPLQPEKRVTLSGVNAGEAYPPSDWRRSTGSDEG